MLGIGRNTLRTRSVKWSVIAIVCIGGTAAFALTSATINGQPRMTPFDGWVAVLEPTSVQVGDRVSLIVTALTPGAPSSTPLLSYTVVVCGDQPFRGALLIGGKARLHPVARLRQISGPTLRDTRRRIPQAVTLGVLGVATRETALLGSVEIVPLDFRSVTRCFGGTRVVGGTAESVSGSIEAPIQHFWHAPLDLWTGPRQSQLWPLVGRMPQFASSDLGAFIFAGTGRTAPLPGEWVRPLAGTFEVDSANITATATTELVRPEPSSSSQLLWRSNDPFAAAARLTSTTATTTWTQRLVVATILLSVGASLLAALLFEWLRPTGAPREASAAGAPRRNETRPCIEVHTLRGQVLALSVSGYERAIELAQREGAPEEIASMRTAPGVLSLTESFRQERGLRVRISEPETYKMQVRQVVAIIPESR